MSLPVSQLAWMAGVLDIKGKIVRKNNKTRKTQQITLMVESKHWQVIRSLAQMTGTAPEMMPAPVKADFYRRNCQEHCDEPHVHVPGHEWPAIGRWTVTGASMGVVLFNLDPFLRVDNGFREAMLEAWDQVTLSGQGAHRTLQSLYRLRNLGWDMPPQYPLPDEKPKEIEAA